MLQETKALPEQKETNDEGRGNIPKQTKQVQIYLMSLHSNIRGQAVNTLLGQLIVAVSCWLACGVYDWRAWTATHTQCGYILQINHYVFI